MIDSSREELEKLPEIAEILNKNGGGYYKEHTNDYHHCNLYFDKFLNGAWYAFQEQQKKLDCCREENRAHLEKIDELQARIRIYEKHVKAIKHIHETQFDENTDTSFILGNLDGFIEYLESDLKGNKDEN